MQYTTDDSVKVRPNVELEALKEKKLLTGNPGFPHLKLWNINIGSEV